MERQEGGVYFSSRDLQNMISFQMTLKAAIELNVFDTIAKSGLESQLTIAEIVSKIPTITNPNAKTSLERILKVLCAYGILSMSLKPNKKGETMKESAVYGLSKEFHCLATTDTKVVSTAANVLVQSQRTSYESFSVLKHAVLEEGCVPFYKAFGMSSYEYMSKDPTISHQFDEAMANNTKFLINEVFKVYKGFENVRELVDVGGGNGAMLGKIISTLYPHIRGINFDLYHVIAAAPKIPGVEHVAGDMFESLPNAETILMKWVLHNWDDDHCKKVLANCWKALPDNGKVIVIEYVIPQLIRNDTASRNATIMDVKMMAFFNSKERTIAEFDDLAKATGFVETKVFPTTQGIHVLEFLKKRSDK